MGTVMFIMAQFNLRFFFLKEDEKRLLTNDGVFGEAAQRTSNKPKSRSFHEKTNQVYLARPCTVGCL